MKASETEEKVIEMHKRLHVWVKTSLGHDPANLPLMLFVMEQEIFRLRNVILLNSLDVAAMEQNGGMYQ